jgi:ribosomal protein S18 acetylase RimI-like enzyme
VSNTLLQAKLGPPTALAAAPLPAGVLLREATRADAPAIAAAYHASYDGEWTPAESLEDIERAFNGGHGALIPQASLVAVSHDGAIVGAVLTVLDAPWDHTPRGPFVIDVFVTPSARGRGIGRALMVAAMAGSPGPTIALRVEDDNPAALALYESLGFAAQQPAAG